MGPEQLKRVRSKSSMKRHFGYFFKLGCILFDERIKLPCVEVARKRRERERERGGNIEMCEKRGEFSATGLPLHPVGLNQEQEVVGSAGWVAPSLSLKPHQTWCEEFLRQQFSSFLVLDQTDKGSFRKHIELKSALIVCLAVSSPRKTHDRGEKKLTNNGNGVFFQGLRHRSKKVWGNWVSVDVRRRRRHVGGQILLRAHRRCKTFWTPNRKKRSPVQKHRKSRFSRTLSEKKRLLRSLRRSCKFLSCQIGQIFREKRGIWSQKGWKIFPSMVLCRNPWYFGYARVQVSYLLRSITNGLLTNLPHLTDLDLGWLKKLDVWTELKESMQLKESP